MLLNTDRSGLTPYLCNVNTEDVRTSCIINYGFVAVNKQIQIPANCVYTKVMVLLFILDRFFFHQVRNIVSVRNS